MLIVESELWILAYDYLNPAMEIHRYDAAQLRDLPRPYCKRDYM